MPIVNIVQAVEYMYMYNGVKKKRLLIITHCKLMIRLIGAYNILKCAYYHYHNMYNIICTLGLLAQDGASLDTDDFLFLSS